MNSIIYMIQNTNSYVNFRSRKMLKIRLVEGFGPMRRARAAGVRHKLIETFHPFFGIPHLKVITRFFVSSVVLIKSGEFVIDVNWRFHRFRDFENMRTELVRRPLVGTLCIVNGKLDNLRREIYQDESQSEKHSSKSDY